MATVKTTVTLQQDDLKKIRDLVAAGKAGSISGFVQHAVAIALNDVAGWGAIVAGALEQTGGALTKTERAWADGILARPDAKEPRRRRAA